MPTFLETLAARDRVQEETQLLLLEREQRVVEQLRREAETTQLLEDCWASSDPYQSQTALDAGLGSMPNDLLHPGAIGRHSARPGSRRDGALPPYYYTEMQHWHLVDAARTVEAFVPTASCILDVLTQFAIFTGFTYQVVEKNPEQPEPAAEGEDPPEPAENPMVEEIQAALDKWLDEVGWWSWESEIFRRTRRDGEAFIVLDEEMETLDGLVGLRAVEPEQVKQPQDSKAIASRAGADSSHTWRFGILTTKHDTSTPLAYWVVSQYNDTQTQGVMYDAEEICHIKTEWVDRQSKRGISDFFVGMNDFPRVRKLLRNLTESASVQACIAWIREHPPGMTPQALGTGAESITTRTGRTTSAVTYDSPQMLDVSNGMKYTAGPLAGTGQSETLIQVLQAALRNIGARWQMPEGLVSGDASNANLASALVAEAPFVHAMECRQWHYRNEFRKLIKRVLDKAAVAGIIPGGEALWEDLDISIDMPPVVPRKALEETQRNQILNERGVMSTQTWAAREDLDYDDEQANIAVAPIEPPSMMLGIDNEQAIAQMGQDADDDTSGESSTATNQEAAT